MAKKLTPSARGELEITDLNNAYLKKKQLRVELLGRGYAWLDTGTYESLLDAGEFIATIERRQSLKIACIEEIAHKLGYIDKKQLLKIADTYSKNSYGQYLKMIAEGQTNAF
jgi:glucose-1-phosphate thymidylyltransferase